MRTFTKNAAKAILGTLVAGAAIMSTVQPASAHASVQLYGSTPKAGGYGHAFIRIPHGCDGAATDTIKVQIPAGFTSVKPQAKSGWTVSTVKADGTNVSEVIWAGGSLADGSFDDFGLSVKYPSTAGTYYMPVVQLCGAASVAWTQIPAAGQDSHSLESPAPSVKIEAASGHGHGTATGAGWTGDVEIGVKHKKATITIDASSIHRHKQATVTVVKDGVSKTIKKVRLDKAGDVRFTVPTMAKNRYHIADGATIEVKVGSKTIATTTVGGTGAGH